MSQKLLIGILGKAKSGKSYTWNLLFGRQVKTGKNLRRLFLNEFEYVDVFLLSRSPQKRKKEVQQIIQISPPDIVLCSLQYTRNVYKTLSWFEEQGYYIYIHWLNPGFSDPDPKPLFYEASIINDLFKVKSLVGVRDGKINASDRVEEIKDFIIGWAVGHNLVKTKSRGFSGLFA